MIVNSAAALYSETGREVATLRGESFPKLLKNNKQKEMSPYFKYPDHYVDSS